MKKYIKLSVTIIVILLICIFIISKTKTEQIKPVFKIGVSLPLTGSLASLGQSSQKAIELALSEFGDTKYEYRVIFEDDAFSPTKAATIGQKFIQVDKTNALISFGSPVGNVMSKTAETYTVPHINSFASDPNVAEGSYNFVHYTPAYKEAQKFVDELKNKDIKTIVIFSQQDNAGVSALVQETEKLLKDTDIKILETVKFNSGTRDFRTLISKIKNLNPDIYLLEVLTPELEILTKQLREAGIRTPLTSMETFEFSDAPELYNGYWYVNAADSSSGFINSYSQKYGENPKLGSANTYDIVKLYIQTIERIGDGKKVPALDQIQKALSETKNFTGAIGQDMNIDEKGFIISEAVVRVIKDGKPITVK